MQMREYNASDVNIIDLVITYPNGLSFLLASMGVSTA